MGSSSRSKKKYVPTTESQQLAMLKWLENEQNFAMMMGAATTAPLPTPSVSTGGSATSAPMFVAAMNHTRRVTKAECYRQLRTHINAQTSANWSVDTTRNRYESYVHMYLKARKLLQKMESKLTIPTTTKSMKSTKLQQHKVPESPNTSHAMEAKLNDMCPFYDRMDALYGHTIADAVVTTTAATSATEVTTGAAVVVPGAVVATHPVVPLVVNPLVTPATIVPSVATRPSNHQREASTSSCSSLVSSTMSQEDDDNDDDEEGGDGEARSTGLSSYEDEEEEVEEEDEDDQQGHRAAAAPTVSSPALLKAAIQPEQGTTCGTQEQVKTKSNRSHRKRSASQVTAQVTIAGDGEQEEEEDEEAQPAGKVLIEASVSSQPPDVKACKHVSAKKLRTSDMDELYLQQQAKQLELYQEELRMRQEELELKKQELEQTETLRQREIKSRLLQALVAAGKSAQEAQEFLTLI